jgi:nucleoside-diphosphate-sugar epimerase
MRIIALTSQPYKLAQLYGGFPGFCCCSFADLRAGALKMPDETILIHCAFARGHCTGRAIAESLNFTADLIDFSLQNGIKSLINLSSQGVYGQDNEPPWIENMQPAPASLYTMAKYAGELLFLNANRGNGAVKVSNLRLASLCGGQANLWPEVISRFVYQALTGESIKIRGGAQVFSYLDVRDAAEAVIRVLLIDPCMWRETYNVGSNRQFTIMTLADLVCAVAREQTGKDVPVEITSADIRQNVGMNATAFCQETGWQPRYTLRDSIESLFVWLSDPINADCFKERQDG